MKQVENLVVFYVVQAPPDHFFHIVVVAPQQTDFVGKRKIMLVEFLHLHFKLGMFLPKFVVHKEPVRTPDHPVKQHHVQHAERCDKEDFPEHVVPQSLSMLAVY